MTLTEYRDLSVLHLAEALETAVMSPTLDNPNKVLPALSAMSGSVRALIRAASSSSAAAYDVADLPDGIATLWNKSEHCLKVLNMMYGPRDGES